MKKEQCYGIIVVRKGNPDLFLLLQHNDSKGSWSFPKGHHEEGETPIETALRETEEETGIKDLDFIDMPMIYEEYEIKRDGEKRLKVNEYFLAFTKEMSVNVQEGEIHTYKWLPFEEAYKTLDYSSRKETLQKAQEYLNMLK
jgi:8-oxo-dGTP pyrophosphatase MutT (NUDIX family)